MIAGRRQPRAAADLLGRARRNHGLHDGATAHPARAPQRGRDGERVGPITSPPASQPCCQCYGATFWAGIDELLIGARADDVMELTEFDEGPLPADWTGELERAASPCASRHPARRARAKCCAPTATRRTTRSTDVLASGRRTRPNGTVCATAAPASSRNSPPNWPSAPRWRPARLCAHRAQQRPTSIPRHRWPLRCRARCRSMN